jgi:MazG family protein
MRETGSPARATKAGRHAEQSATPPGPVHPHSLPRPPVSSSNPESPDSLPSPRGETEGPPIPPPRAVPGSLDRAVEMVHFLRRHCPWDARQTPESLIPHLVEETHEVVDAIQGNAPGELEAELGDLLLNLAFQVAIGEESGHFDRESVTARLEEKMRRRHPHLFGLGEPASWESLKARERAGEGPGLPAGEAGILSGLASGLDPLMKAHRIQEKVSGVGFDWDSALGAWAKVAEEVEEVREVLDGSDPEHLEEELGDLLFAVVNLTRLAGAHPTTALERANRKFRRRFEALEELARIRGIVLHEAGLEALDLIWEEVKTRERSGS